MEKLTDFIIFHKKHKDYYRKEESLDQPFYFFLFCVFSSLFKILRLFKNSPLGPPRLIQNSFKEKKVSESAFKKKVKNKIQNKFNNIEIFELDSSRKRSIPDMLIVGRDCWAALEFKRSNKAHLQPNQAERISNLSKIGYAAFIFPENEEDIFHDLEKLFST